MALSKSVASGRNIILQLMKDLRLQKIIMKKLFTESAIRKKRDHK